MAKEHNSGMIKVWFDALAFTRFLAHLEKSLFLTFTVLIVCELCFGAS